MGRGTCVWRQRPPCNSHCEEPYPGLALSHADGSWEGRGNTASEAQARGHMFREA